MKKRRIVSLLLAAAILAAALTGCANLKVGLMLLPVSYTHLTLPTIA